MIPPVPRAAPRALAGEIERHRTAAGLELCLVRNRQAPIVSSALFYRIGGRDEPAGRSGVAHFLEHMMFKGTARFGPGEIDRLTQAMGGTSNAFTSHDATAYYFAFAADRWPVALEIEADRMRGLALDAREVESERQVIVEEIAMYRDEPWDALEQDVLAALWGAHPYGRPVLGRSEDLEREDAEVLAAFHADYYRPDNGVLVIAGDLGDDAVERVESAFAGLDRSGPVRPALAPPAPPDQLVRLERRHGEVARLLLALPVPGGDQPDLGGLKLLGVLLAAGRSSRLQRALVEEGELCLAVSAGAGEGVLASTFTVGAEVLPGVDPAEVERRILAELAELAARTVAEEELARGRQLLLADWVFGQERIHQQALVAGSAAALFDLEQPQHLLDRSLAAGPEELRRLASRYLNPAAGGVIGLSLPE